MILKSFSHNYFIIFYNTLKLWVGTGLAKIIRIKMNLKTTIKLNLSMRLSHIFNLTVDLEFVNLILMMKIFWSVKKRLMMAIQLMKIRKEFQSIMEIIMNKVTVEMDFLGFPGMRPWKIFKEIWGISLMNLKSIFRAFRLLSLPSLLSSIWLRIQGFSKINLDKEDKI